jgi:hypothetical protein
MPSGRRTPTRGVSPQPFLFTSAASLSLTNPDART